MNELEILTLVTLMTAMMWLPYVFDRIIRQGLVRTVGYPETPVTLAPWAQRAQQAH